MNTAIVVAAGRGDRFNSTTPKQLTEILGKPVIIHTLEKFEACEMIERVVVVVPPDGIPEFERLISKFAIKKVQTVVAGGTNRTESVRNGFDTVDPNTEIVAVHDGVRPLVSVDEISATIQKARETGAACLVATVTDTIKKIEGGLVTATLDRSNLRRALTPQAFRYAILKQALNGDPNDQTTDECMLVETLGCPIAYVEGSPRNIKITHPEDRFFAESILRNTQ